MNTDYTHQLEQLISVLSHKDVVPTWVISIISVVIGSLLTATLGIWKERHDAKRRRKRLARAIYGELLLNYSSLFGTLATDYDFNRIKPTQTPFGGIFTFDTLENAKTQGDILYDVPNFAAMRTLYKMYQSMAELHGGGTQAQGLAHDGVREFETFFAQHHLDQSLLIELCETCAPNSRSRLIALSRNELKPGQI